jgi:hypothetical protein
VVVDFGSFENCSCCASRSRWHLHKQAPHAADSTGDPAFGFNAQVREHKLDLIYYILAYYVQGILFANLIQTSLVRLPSAGIHLKVEQNASAAVKSSLAPNLGPCSHTASQGRIKFSFTASIFDVMLHLKCECLVRIHDFANSLFQ